MTGKEIKSPAKYMRQAAENVKKYLESLTRGQRLKIIAAMILVLLLADI